MNKAYKRINWENKPSTASPINETNLNKMDHALDTVDTRVVEIYNQKDAMSSATTAANKAADSANTAATSANTAAANANEAAQAVLDEKYILTARTEMVRSGTARPTAKGNAILEKLTGDSWQNQMTGKNLVNNIADSISNNGLTMISNGDGTYTVNGTANADTIWTIHAHIQDVLTERETYKIVGCPVGGAYNTYRLVDSYTGKFYDDGDGYVFTCTAGEIYYIAIKICKGTTCNNLVFKPMITKDLTVTYDDFEPYCGNTPSPNPSFKQDIRSIGDMGWFDGEWARGYYDDGDIFVSSTNRVSNKNPIPCTENDEFILLCEKNAHTMGVLFFDEHKNVVGSKTVNATNKLSIIVPANTNYCRWYIFDSGLTPQTVGHVCVTINGKYAAIVDEVWKNLFDESQLLLASGWVYENGYYTGRNSSLNPIYGSKPGFLANLKENTPYAISLKCRSDITSDASYISVKYTDGTFSNIVIGNSTTEREITYVTNAKKSVASLIFGYGSGGTLWIKNFQIEEGTEATPYKPHQSKRTYIPLDEPLRGIGDVKDEICYRDGLYGECRGNIRDVFDGSKTFRLHASLPSLFYYVLTANLPYVNNKVKGFALCSHYRQNNYSNVSALADGEFAVGINSSGNYLVYFKDSSCSTADEFNQKLQTTPIILEYALAEPTFTPFEDQIPFYNLQSFDEVTHVSIAGLHDELKSTLTMRFPRHEDGALVTTSYCNSKKAEIRMDELTAAMLALSQS